MSTTSARNANWIEHYLRERGPREAPSLWDWLPRDLRERILLYERHRLVKHMIFRCGIAFAHVQTRALREYDQIDFSKYIQELKDRLEGRLCRDTKRATVNRCISELLTATVVAVPWMAPSVQSDARSKLRKHDDGYGFYAHLSWLRWKDRNAWSQCPVKSKQWDGIPVSMELFEQRKIRFEGLDVACSASALREANVALVDRGKL
jgi:hypothetical protein